MSVLDQVGGAIRALKIFPLPSAVLFPGTAIPLHIFEPRYRELIQDCLAEDKVMGLAQLSPGWESSYYERPELHPICCAGVLAWHDSLPDGRFNVLLQGVVRARVLEELPAQKPYRQVRVELLPDATFHGPEEETLRQAVFELSLRLGGNPAEGLVSLAANAEGGALADAVAGAVVTDLARRQMLLGQLSVSKRLASVMGDVGELIGRLEAVKPHGPVN
jgi:uncharacterized protein